LDELSREKSKNIGNQVIAMTSSTTLKIRIAPELKTKLGRLADTTQRSRSSLATAAIETYVTRELAIVDGIARGLADMEAGLTMNHEDAMTFIRRRIDGAT
jgi:predicted transcriptional regulator